MDLGGQLDSLADMVTFRRFAGVMLYNILQFKANFITVIASNTTVSITDNPISLLGFVYTLFACLRLAKFNLDTVRRLIL